MQSINILTGVATEESFFGAPLELAFDLCNTNGLNVIVPEMLYEQTANVPFEFCTTYPFTNNAIIWPDLYSQPVDVSLPSGPVPALVDGFDAGISSSSLRPDLSFGDYSTSEARPTGPQDVSPPNELRYQESYPFAHLVRSQKISVLIDHPPRHFKRWQTRIRNGAKSPSFSLYKVISQIYRHLERDCGIEGDELTRWYFMDLLEGKRPTTYTFRFGARPN